MRLPPRTAGALGALLAGLSVAVGAFGTHTLSQVLTEARMGTLETAVRYQMYAGLGLLVMALAARVTTGSAAARAQQAAALLALGVLLFSGALYLLVAGGPRLLGAVAPVGGSLTVFAWLWLALGLWNEER